MVMVPQRQQQWQCIVSIWLYEFHRLLKSVLWICLMYMQMFVYFIFLNNHPHSPPRPNKCPSQIRNLLSSLTFLNSREAKKTCLHCHSFMWFLSFNYCRISKGKTLFPLLILFLWLIHFHLFLYLLAEFLYVHYLSFKLLSHWWANLLSAPPRLRAILPISTPPLR